MAAFAFLPLLAALGAGLVLGVWICRRHHAERLAEARSAGVAEGQSQAAVVTGKLEMSAAQVAQLERELEAARREAMAVTAQIASLVEQQRSAEKLLEAERTRVTALQEQLPQSFKSVAADVLGEARAALAKEFSDKQSAGGELLEQKELAIDALLKPMRETLAKLDQQTRDMESKRDEAYGSVRELVENMQQSHRDLRAETSQLVSALRKPEVRGYWGELQLRRCIEFAGMIEHCDFAEQSTIRTADGDALRPDVVVNLPNGRVVAVDAKVPLTAFSEASTAATAEERAQLLQQHASQLRRHLQQLETKAYGKALARMGSPELVVCFLPSEVLLSAALDADPSLIAYSPTVVLATPTTLIALLKAVACGWQQMEVARSAEQIRETAESIYAKLAAAQKNVTSLGDHIRRAVDQYNEFLTKVEGRGGIFSLGRKLREMKIGDKDIPELASIDHRPRLLHDGDWQAADGLRLAASEEVPLN